MGNLKEFESVSQSPRLPVFQTVTLFVLTDFCCYDEISLKSSPPRPPPPRHGSAASR